MAVKIINRSYSEIFTEGTTDWLLANVGEWQKLRLKCEVAVEYLASEQKPIDINYIDNAFVISSGEKWGDYGFDDGMEITLRYKKSIDTDNDGTFDQVTSHQETFLITKIYGSTMEVQEEISLDDFDSIPTNFGTKKITDVLFFVEAIPEGCSIKYGHIVNEDVESGQLNSFIDGSETKFIFPGLNSLSMGNWGTMEAVGEQSGMSVRSVKVREVPNNTSGMLTSFTVPKSAELSLISIDNFFSNPKYDSIRSIKMNIDTPATNYKSVANDNFLPQSNSSSEINGGNLNQVFLFDADGSYSQDFLLNLNFRITSVTSDVGKRENYIRIVAIKYTNGSSFDFVERTVLQEWSNVKLQVNKILSVNGIYSFDINDSDSYVFAVEYFELTSSNTNKVVKYVMDEGFIQVSNPDESLETNYKRHFEIETEFMLSSFFEDPSNFETLQMPSYLTGNGSLTDNFLIEFYPEWNNPNVKVVNDMKQTQRLGNTGWFNENYNELTNDFKIDSVQYFDINGNQVESLDYANETKVKIIISGVPNLNSQTECGFGFAWIPENDEDYKNKETPFYRNLFIQSGSIEDGFKLDTLYQNTNFGAGLNGGSMDTTSVRFTSFNGTIVAEILFKPNTEFFNIFDNKEITDRNFILWISVADGSLSRNFSDRASLLVDYGSLVKSIPPAGEYPYLDATFIEHPFDENHVGETSIEGVTQDDFLVRIPFRIKKDNSTVFQQIEFGVEAFNIGLNYAFDLESYEIDLTQYPTDTNGVQQFNFDQTRGFKLNDGNNKNWVKVQREPLLDTVEYSGYMAYFATKIRYEDWILNQSTPNYFFDASKLNNGFNNDWFDYLSTNGWNINFYVKINSLVNDDLFQYKNQFRIKFSDYDQNENISVTHNYFRDSDDTLLNVGVDPETGKTLGVILSSEPTRIEISFDILDDGVWDIANTYAVTTIEIDKGVGRMEMRQLSSVWDSESDNPLVPLEGETKLKMEVDGTNKILKTSCLVDPDLLTDAIRYRITGRVGCKDETIDTFDPGLYEFRYETTYE